MNLQVIKNRVKKALAYSITSVLFIIISAFLILQMPPVQKRVIAYYLKDFSKVTGFNSTIGGFKMLWFDRLELTDVSVYDPEGNKMIRASEILINFKLSQLIEERDINIDGIYLDSAHVLLTKINDGDTARDLNLNVLIGRINDKYSSGSSGGGRPPRINIGEAILNQSQFSFINQDQDSVKRGFNYNQFSLAVDEAQLKSFVVIGDTTQFQVRTLIAQDLNTKFRVKQLSTFFRISQKAMEFHGLNLSAGSSTVQDTIVFHYNRQVDLNNFISKVRIHANLKKTFIHHEDLALFAPGVERLGNPMTVSGIIDGRVNKFKITEMDVHIGNTALHGSLDMDGLPEINETFIILNIKDSRFDPNDLAFALNSAVLERLRPMGRLELDGQFLGYPTDFVANGTFTGRLGAIKSDINFKVNESDFNKSVYIGRLALQKFNLGEYLGDTSFFQKVTLDGRISGSGLTQKTADFKLDGTVNSIGINRYNYQHINTNARFASGLFSGFVNVNDPNLQLIAKGSVDLREGKNRIKIEAKLDTALLHKLNLSRDFVFIHSNFAADVKGLTLDSLMGHANFSDVYLKYKDQSLELDEISVDAARATSYRSIAVNSTLLDAEVKGNYSLKNLTHDLQILAKEIQLNIRNDQRAIEQYYQAKNYRPETYEADISILLKDIRPLVRLLNVDLSLAAETKVQGRFTSGYTSIFNMYAHLDSVTYNGMTMVQTEAELNASKIADSTAVLAMATVTSDRQILNPRLTTKNLLLEAIWSKSHIDFSLDADQEGPANYVRLQGDVDFLADSTRISMDPSEVKLLEREWKFSPGNYLMLGNDGLTFHQLALQTGLQSLAINGHLSRDPAAILNFDINEFDLSSFNVLTQQKVAGVMNAQVALSNYYRKPTIQNSIDIRNFTVDDFLIGNVSGENRWDTVQRKFVISLGIDREAERMVNISGDYSPSNTESPLNINATLQKAQLKIAEPFLIDIFSHIGGTVSGDFKITGKLAAPDISGEGDVADGQLMINYLKTIYRFKGKIGLTPGSIYFKDISLVDAFRNMASLNGSITHRGFASMAINLNANFQNFQVLNTSSKDNNLFYGQAYATGDVSFTGPLSNLKISSTAQTQKNTRIYIPISGTSSVETKEFISFVKLNDTTFAKKVDVRNDNKVNLTGLTFDLNLDVTPDAYCEIIFDLKSGDIIRGRGNGDLKLQIDTKGDFTMFGPFEFTQGWYNFTLYDIINKEFEIQKGSRISWYGDPYQGILNINASYNQQASIAPILPDQSATNAPQLRRKYPVQVLLKLEEYMLTPKITLDIVAKDLPKNIVIPETGRTINLDIEFAAFKNKLDEQELARQVFSLIVLRRFAPPESLDASGSVVSSVSELLSNQLSYWMSQVDQKLEVDVDLGSMDQDAFNSFQLRVAYQVTNRLRLTGDGTYNNTSTPGATNQQSVSSFAGDWTLEYLLTADGRLRVKMYSRSNVNPVLSTVNNQNAFTTGASLIHTQSFDRLSDLWRSSRKRRLEEEEERKKKKESESDKKEEAPVEPLSNQDALKEDDDPD
jgi:hypothetical protein